MSQDNTREYVYRLHHWRDEDNDETYKEIGIFSTFDKAKIAEEHYKQLPGFYAYPDCFAIQKIRLNDCSWESGFDVHIVLVPLKDKEGYATVRARGEHMHELKEVWYGLFEIVSGHAEKELIFPLESVVRISSPESPFAVEAMAENYESFIKKYGF